MQSFFLNKNEIVILNTTKPMAGLLGVLISIGFSGSSSKPQRT